MARRPAFARALVGRWRIVEMDNRPDDVVDVGGEAHILFTGDNDGEIAVVAVKGFLDVRYACVTGARPPSSPARASTAAIPSPDEDGQASEPPFASSGTATSASGRDFFNVLAKRQALPPVTRAERDN
jgi:hypothetical protein